MWSLVPCKGCGTRSTACYTVAENTARLTVEFPNPDEISRWFLYGFSMVSLWFLWDIPETSLGIPTCVLCSCTSCRPIGQAAKRAVARAMHTGPRTAPRGAAQEEPSRKSSLSSKPTRNRHTPDKSIGRVWAHGVCSVYGELQRNRTEPSKSRSRSRIESSRAE